MFPAMRGEMLGVEVAIGLPAAMVVLLTLTRDDHWRCEFRRPFFKVLNLFPKFQLLQTLMKLVW